MRDMKKQMYRKQVNLPEVDDFLDKYSRYTKFVSGEGRFLFDLIMQPEVLVAAQVLADFKLPSVLAVAEQCRLATEESRGSVSLVSFTKQFIGAAICVLLEANGYRKTGIKKSVPHPSFTVGEFYERDKEQA
jgi:hypothetical protein